MDEFGFPLVFGGFVVTGVTEWNRVQRHHMPGQAEDGPHFLHPFGVRVDRRPHTAYAQRMRSQPISYCVPIL